MLEKYNSYLPDLKESWTLVALLVVAGSLISGIIAVLIKYIFPHFSGWAEIISYPLIFIPPYLWMRRTIKLNINTESNNDSPNFGKLGALLSFILIFPLVFAFNLITEPFTMWMETPDFIKELMHQVSENRISSFIMIVVLAPILEEVFCRGIILRGLLKHMSPLKAILWSALIFGVIHLNPWQAIPAFLIGSLMGWIYWKTRSLWTTIFIHFVNNGFAYVITIFFPELPEDVGYYEMIPGIYYYIFYAFALLSTISILLIMNKFYDKSIPYKV